MAVLGCSNNNNNDNRMAGHTDDDLKRGKIPWVKNWEHFM